ncbi:MAG TPA: response regulator transcription factor [Anaerolineales bacterium]|nr:response regulator transcription factor [Anaerolineales bacterium]HRF48013.1 response regulator transcription factor [Anaerolineales bacterium]
MIDILVCDDQLIVCEGLTRILSSDPEITVVGVAHDGAEALARVDELRPQLVLMDLKMPGVNGIIATRKIKEQHPSIPVLVLTTYDDDEWVFDALRSGAAGYLLKDTPPRDLIASIKGTVAGKTFLDPMVAGKVLTDYQKHPSTPAASTRFQISDRERELLRLLASGLSNGEIAQQLYLSEGTVRNYASELFKKLGVSDRTQAVVIALRHGLVSLGDI